MMLLLPHYNAPKRCFIFPTKMLDGLLQKSHYNAWIMLEFFLVVITFLQGVKLFVITKTYNITTQEKIRGQPDNKTATNYLNKLMIFHFNFTVESQFSLDFFFFFIFSEKKKTFLIFSVYKKEKFRENATKMLE